MKSSALLSVVPGESQDESSNHQVPKTIQIEDVASIDKQLEQVEKDIQTILSGIIGNPYAPLIRRINTAEGLIDDKAMGKGQPAMVNLKTNLIIWKDYIGSAICALLEANLKEETKRLKNLYLMDDLQIEDNIDNIQLCTHDVLRKIMAISKIGGKDTKGGIEFDSTKRIVNIPETIKIPMMGAKGTIPQLLVAIKMINLMLAKVTLKNIKVALNCRTVYGLLAEEILKKNETSDEHK